MFKFQLPHFKVYLPPTNQSSWSKRPFHVSLSSSLWTDLLLVAILFRLNEFTLIHLNPGIHGLWLPITIFFAIYDAWETRVLFDSVFKYQDDMSHHVIGILQWLLLALMATAITPSETWAKFDALFFSGLKLAHQSIRMFNYIETWFLSQSKRARKSARARSLVYLISYPFYLAALGIIATDESLQFENLNLAASMWVIAFFLQRFLWAYLKWDPLPNPYIPFYSDCVAIKTNVPFKTARYADWTMLQLGAIILGFMTVPTTNLTGFGVLVFGYLYVACLNLFSYSINPENPSQHALVRGGIPEFIWLELFSLAGLGFMGIAVGLRAHLFYPQLVVLPHNRHFTWLLCISAQVCALAMYAQEQCHGGMLSRVNHGLVVYLKLFSSSMFLMTAIGFIYSDSQNPSLAILGLALTSLLVLAIQVLNGAFKRRIFKTEHLKLMGNFRAAVIGMVLLHRARRNLQQFPPEVGVSRTTTATTVTSSAAIPAAPAPKQLVGDEDVTVFQINSPLSITSFGSLPDRNTGAAVAHKHTRRASLISSQISTRLSLSTPNKKIIKDEIRTWRIVLNDKLYSPPHVYVEGNKATKYRVQWSDLFFDVLFVGVVFRLGDLLLSGIGMGYSETSVHYNNLTLGGNTSYAAYNDPSPARSDAVFIFLFAFLAMWSMWQNRLAYGSKVGTGDVAHKVVDMLQGLTVMLTATNITTQDHMQDKSSGNAYAVSGGLLAFQLSTLLLWLELAHSSAHNTPAKGTAIRNVQRDLMGILPLLCSFATIAMDQSLLLTSFLWSLSWFFPFCLRVFSLKLVNDHNSVRDLHRYVIHRLGDGALIVLGEGVLQIVRAQVYKEFFVFSYLSIVLGLFLVTTVRIAVWSMDCFHDQAKHAQLLSLNAGLAAFFVRSLAGPALVAMGVAMKKIVSVGYSGTFEAKNTEYYWLLCGSSCLSAVTQILTYELHRFASRKQFRKQELLLMLFIALTFIYWALIPVASWVIEALCLGTWLGLVLVHFLLDDYFLLKERAKNRGDTAHSVYLQKNASTKSVLWHPRQNLRKAFSRGFFSSNSAGRVLFSRKDKKTSGLDELPKEKKFYPLVKRERGESTQNNPQSSSHSRKVNFEDEQTFRSQSVGVSDNPLFDGEEEDSSRVVHFAAPSMNDEDAPIVVASPAFVAKHHNFPSGRLDEDEDDE